MKKLFESNQFADLELRNRFVRSGTWIAKADDEGFVTKELLDYYEKLSLANLGMVIVGYSRAIKGERANDNMIGTFDDKFIPGLKELTKIFHANNTPVGIQLAVGGTTSTYSGEVTWKIPSPSNQVTKAKKDEYGNKKIYEASEMTTQEIEDMIEEISEAAFRVKRAGFDMVQLHGAHGYFISQWLNPKINTREDEYGKDKTKFTVDLYKAIRSKVGDDFLIGIKLNSEEEIGSTENYDLALELAIKLDNLGINLIEVSGNAPSRTKIKIENESYFKEFAKSLTTLVNCTTMLTGGNKTFDNIEKVLKETNVDLIGLSRTLVSEIDLVKRWQMDTTIKSRCISCNHCHRVVNVCIFDK